MWQRTGTLDPTTLWETRLQLHWAAQPAAGVGRSKLEKLPDFSHESFQWSDEHGALLQGLVAARRPFRAGIRIRDLTLLLLDEHGETIAVLPMNGRMLDDGFAFFEQHSCSNIARPPDGMPAHATTTGKPFNASQAQLEELERYYTGASTVLHSVASREAGASSVRCWPHHFDIALLITLGGSGEDARTIGAGMSPGDEGCREPYYYVTPWPYPEVASLPPLSVGKWNTQGWVGAVLRASDFAAAPDQRSMIESFVCEAIGHCRSLLG